MTNQQQHPQAPLSPRAAVALVIAHAPTPHILLLQRARHPDDPWSGHWSFPGGHIEPTDETPLDAAIRETQEEAGLTLLKAEHTSTLPISEAGGAKHSTLVAPFAFTIQSQPPLALDSREIAKAHWLPLKDFKNQNNHQSQVMDDQGQNKQAPCFPIKNGPDLWGFTYGVLKYYVNK